MNNKRIGVGRYFLLASAKCRAYAIVYLFYEGNWPLLCVAGELLTHAIISTHLRIDPYRHQRAIRSPAPLGSRPGTNRPAMGFAIPRTATGDEFADSCLPFS